MQLCHNETRSTLERDVGRHSLSFTICIERTVCVAVFCSVGKSILFRVRNKDRLVSKLSRGFIHSLSAACTTASGRSFEKDRATSSRASLRRIRRVL